MATTTQQNPNHTDEFGIERVTSDSPSLIDKLRLKWQWFDHIMLMNERYGLQGGNQYAAGITYFSVLSLFPILLLVIAVVATVLANNPDMLLSLNERITSSVDGQMGEILKDILSTAIDQRAAMFGVGGITALWSGLNWMNNLRYGVSKMWKYPVAEANFFKTKLVDLLGLVILLTLLILALGVTALGNSGLTIKLLTLMRLDTVPGITYVVSAVAIGVGLLANFLVFFWLLKQLPRGEVPWRSALKGSLIGALAFEVFKQLGSIFFSSALNNPAGATFGPIIGVMVLFYFIWRILLYCSAWAATTKESLAIALLDAPAPAIIRVREELPIQEHAPRNLGVGVALGAATAAVVSTILRK
ncbi:YhjD/YihY/BrkB family envelope integrity protein [Corynebacterium sp. HS2168-gen11]|uniref:YhjD/YihY/BrkB family envelope integrity protein n=1 Tax=Corynebacterium sp. HS2168-gen11 TaxID=2974027 RepID=UPI00216B3129|nr:YhjD/YihY/BrkB family envelope integrity protein [Corynebacterium sp. HS2168-gen11]MCS4535882.1 YihY family inner membrane protein [Corynebacterium sp. HS2168-gen11]